MHTVRNYSTMDLLLVGVMLTAYRRIEPARCWAMLGFNKSNTEIRI